ncbi:hypothetical protein ZIOFF_051530 [Zingiber officinale]|uniref:Mon2/Sec7/BIG1-like HDS domain-containing protein n=1 Tax=Zingiber officinale TaxID=94328 RepID=A0A8J5KHF4_ZINOF|nr:hypothetical protein ZIOFF_051530 [Zingiber officinale]
MDSLRQLAMKFLEREELANYNFQNEFLKPFVAIMQKSNSSEICELIVRCVSQMILSCINHVKSGWKSVFMVFTTAVADDRSLHCLLTVYTWKKCTLSLERNYASLLEVSIFLLVHHHRRVSATSLIDDGVICDDRVISGGGSFSIGKPISLCCSRISLSRRRRDLRGGRGLATDASCPRAGRRHGLAMGWPPSPRAGHGLAAARRRLAGVWPAARA